MTGQRSIHPFARRAFVRAALVAGLALAGWWTTHSSADASIPCDTTWTSTANGIWTDAGNWNNGVPTGVTNACIPAAVIVTIPSGDYFVNALDISNPSAVLDIRPGTFNPTTLTLNADSSSAGLIRLLPDGIYGATLKTATAAVLTNTGTITASPAPSSSSAENLNANIKNSGTISIARDARTEGLGRTITNTATGVFDVASGATFTMFAPDTFDNSDGLIRVHDKLHFVINGGTLKQGGETDRTFTRFPIELNAGNLQFVGGGTRTKTDVLARYDVNLSGDLRPDDVVVLAANNGNPANLTIGADLVNNGTIDLVAENIYDARLRTINGAKITNADYGSGFGSIITTGSVTGVGSESVGGGTGNLQLAADIVNPGRLDIARSAQTDFTGHTITNTGASGQIFVRDGATLTVHVGDTLNNASGEIRQFTSGQTLVSGAGTFVQGAGSVTGSNPVLLENATLTMTPGLVGSGLFTSHYNLTFTGDIDPLEVLTIEGNNGDPAKLNATAPFTNNGELALRSSGIYDALLNTNFTLTNNGRFIVVTGPAHRSSVMPIVNHGHFEPGTGAQRLAQSAPFDQTGASAGSWVEHIWDTTSDFDQLSSTSTIAIGGTLDIAAQPDVEPAVGTTIRIATGSSVTGTFATVTQTPFADGRGWKPVYGATFVDLTFGDVAGPAASTVTITTAPINAGNASAVGVTASCESGATLNLTAADTNASTNDVTASMTCPGGGLASFTLDLQSLDDGTITASVTQTDTAGNTGPAGTDTTSKDAVVPGAPTVTITTDPVTADNATAVSIDGTCETGDTVSLLVVDASSATNDVTGSQTCVAGGYSITIDASALADGTIAAAVTQTDGAGNTSTPGADTAQKTTTPPDAEGSIDITPAYINAANQAAVPYTGTCVTGNRVDITVSDLHDHTVTVPQFTCVGGAYSATFDASTLSDDATITAAAVQTDAANVAHSPDTDTAIKDTLGPTGTTVNIVPAYINAASNQAAVPYIGTCTTGNPVNVAIGDAHGHESFVSFTCASNSFHLSFDARDMAEGDLITIAAVEFDAAGNRGTPATDPNRPLKDTVAPTDAEGSIDITPSVITPANQATVPFTGTCVAGNTITAIKAVDQHQHSKSVAYIVCGDDGTFSGTFNASAFNDERVELKARQVDPAGNTGVVEKDTATKATASIPQPDAPTINPTTIPSDGTDSAVHIAGTCVAPYQVSLAVNDDDPATNAVPQLFACPNTGGYDRSFDLRTLVPGTITVSAHFLDASGTAGPDRVVTTTKSTHRFVSPGADAINAANQTQIPLAVSCSTGTDVSITLYDSKKPNAANNGPAFACPAASGFLRTTADASGFKDGAKVLFRATEKNKSGAVMGFTEFALKKDTVVPTAPSAAFTPDPIRTLAQAQAIHVRGTCETDAKVTVEVSGSNRQQNQVRTQKCVASTYDTKLDVSKINRGTLTTKVSQADAAGNTSPTTTITTQKQLDAP
ncbi:MAG TPA: hypothetical protein VHC63_04395 [Acidimicrobiales bacterium]|nr:hypothetical protein [Acidimicrobiales bacterium]